MALDDEDEAPLPQGTASPALQEFPDVFTHPAAKEWASEAATRLNDYFQRRQLAENAAAVGQDFVNNVDQFKSGLVSMVQSDPHAVHVALDLVPSTVSALINGMPNAPGNSDEHHAALTGHMQSEIAAAAVTSAAESHEGVARALLGNERIQSVLGDAVGPLGVYTDMQAAARQRDQEADRGQAQAAQVEIADNSARNYIGALVDPNNGKPRSPPGWNQAVMADNKVPPQLKVDLFDVHERLGTNGDAQTDPHALMAMVQQMAQGQTRQNAIYPMLGNNLSLADAGTLFAAAGNQKTIQTLDATLQAAARQIAPNGDIGETRALGRFINWLIPAWGRGGSIDPRDEDYIIPSGDETDAYRFWNSFRVNGDDLIGGSIPGTSSGLDPTNTADRPSLSEIFGRGRVPPVRMPTIQHPPKEKSELHAGNEPLQPLPMIPSGGNPLSPPGANPKPIGGTESGDFFQRKIREGGGGKERA